MQVDTNEPHVVNPEPQAREQIPLINETEEEVPVQMKKKMDVPTPGPTKPAETRKTSDVVVAPGGCPSLSRVHCSPLNFSDESDGSNQILFSEHSVGSIRPPSPLT